MLYLPIIIEGSPKLRKGNEDDQKLFLNEREQYKLSSVTTKANQNFIQNYKGWENDQKVFYF